MATTPTAALDALRRELQSLNTRRFEELVAALVGRMIGVPMVVAKSGFQHGADAGTAGREGRRLRIEAKRYSDAVPLNDREILGELEQATQRDPALELWALATTTAANEQLESSLFASAAGRGVPVVIIDWKTTGAVPTLAALCASAPDVVRELAGDPVAVLVRDAAAAEPRLADEAEVLRRSLAAWNVGYASTAASARRWLDRLWCTPAESVAALGQDAAGGAEPTFVPRPDVSGRLDAWLTDAPVDAPAVIVGDEGMGKTWAAIGWLIDSAETLPIVLVIPSGMVTAASASANGMRELIAARLAEVTNVRDAVFWTARLDYMLRRPDEEGPALLLMLDGMNQEPRAPWEAVHRILQASPFAGRVRVISSTRPLSFESDMRHLSRLVVPPVKIDVGPYDDAPGGEFDRALGMHGLRRSDLREDLLPLARVPRLLELVVRLRDRLAGLGRVTVHGLLWEYGRDTLGVRSGRTFDEQEWRAWLAEAANRFRITGRTSLTRRDLEDTASQPSLDAAQVRKRLSDIVDGQLADVDAFGGAVLRPAIVAQALGVAITAHLERLPAGTAIVDAALERWLDPIAGFTERSEILRAAVAIGAAQGSGVHPGVLDALVAAWLATRNLPDDHRRDIQAFAPSIVGQLLSAVETLRGQPLASARDVAIEAIRSIPRSDVEVRTLVAGRAERWMRTVSRDADDRTSRSEEGERARTGRLVSRTGSDDDGERRVLGRALTFVRSTSGHALAFVPSLIEGYPMAPFIDVFEAAALQLAIRDRFDVWVSFEWLTLFNVTDQVATAAALRNRAAEMTRRHVEAGVDPRLRSRAAALLLRLAADPIDEVEAQSVDARFETVYDYDEEYEARPTESCFALERRHAGLVIDETATDVGERLRRLDGHWWDPTLPITNVFSTEVEAFADGFETKRPSTGRFKSADDLDFDLIRVAAARCCPAALARLARRRIAAFGESEEGWSRLGEGAYQSLLIGDGETAHVLQRARGGRAVTAALEAEEVGTAQLLMQPTLVNLDPEAQVDVIMDGLPTALFTNVHPFLRRLDAGAVDRLVDRYRDGPERATELLVDLLSAMAEDVGDEAFDWLHGLASDPSFSRRSAVYGTLARCRPVDFGLALLEAGFSWSDAGDDLIAHHGSLAILRATLDVPFETVAHRIAPWLVGRAARERGAEPGETRIAAGILAGVVEQPDVEVRDTVSGLSVDENRRPSSPFAVTITTGAGRGTDDTDRPHAFMDEDARERAVERAVERALERIRPARSAGASLYLSTIDADDLAPMLEHAPDIVDRWFEGATECTSAFRRRVRLAEGLFIALVEATMRIDCGAALPMWRTVRRALITKFIGTAGIDRMILILLAAPREVDIDEVVATLAAPASCSTDEALMQISVAAAAAGRAELLLALADEDGTSGVAWRRERGKALEAFAPGTGSAPAARDGRGTATQHRDSIWRERLYRDSAARHWWDAYWSAPDGETAFACWTLLLSCVDRRALEWSRRSWPADAPTTPLERRKRIYADWQRDELKRAAERSDKDLGRSLYQRRLVKDVAPWTRLDPVNAD